LETVYPAGLEGFTSQSRTSGPHLAFVGVKNGTSQIYIRRLGQLQASLLAGTSGAQSPFFSPDGQWLAFFADGKLKKISVTGGAAVTLADAPNGRGGSWGDDGNIVFNPDNTRNSLQRVSSAGGKVELLTKLGDGETTHRWPQVLPGAKAVLYMTNGPGGGGYDLANIIVQQRRCCVIKYRPGVSDLFHYPRKTRKPSPISRVSWRKVA
jgi:serine/threonine-protein kinase